MEDLTCLLATVRTLNIETTSWNEHPKALYVLLAATSPTMFRQNRQVAILCQWITSMLI